MSDKFAGGIKAGSTSVSVPVILRKTADNTENTGTLAANITAYYWRQGGTPTAVTAASDLAAITSAFSAGGWKAADATNAPGTYRLDVDDAAFATGADWVVISVKVASCYLFVEKYALTTNVVQTGDSYARIGAAGASLTAITGVTLATSQPGVTIPTVTTVTNQLTAAAIATGVWTDTTAGDFTTSASIGKSIMNGIALGTGLTVNDLTTKTGFSLSNGSFVTATFGTCDLTSTMKTSVATAVWTDTVAGDFTVSASVGKSVMNGIALGTGLTIVRVLLVQ